MNTATETKSTESNKGQRATLECNICYEEASEPVATNCGHIYCWPCIYKWLDAKKDQASCPVCNNVISKDKLVSLFARGETGRKKYKKYQKIKYRHTDDIPKRPQPEREERKENSENNQNANARFGAFQGFHGFGIFNGLLGGFHFNFGNLGVSFGFPQLIPMLIFFLFNFLSGSFYQYESDFTNEPNTNTRRASSSSTHNTRNSFQQSTQNSRQQQNNYLSGPGMTFVITFCIVLFFAMPYIIRRFNRR